MATQTTKELDALYVAIRIDDQPFLKSVQTIQTGLDGLEQRFVQFGQNVASAFGTGMKDVSRSLSNIGKFLQAIKAVAPDPDQIAKISGPLKKFAEDFNNDIVPKLTKAGSGDATQALSRIGTFIRALDGFTYDSKKVSGMAGALQTLFGSLAATAQNNPGFDLASQTVGRLAAFGRSMMAFDARVLANSIGPISKFFDDIGKVNSAAAIPAIEALSKMYNALARMSKVDNASIANATKAAQNAMTALNSLTVGPNVTASLNALQRLSLITQRMGRGATGGGAGGGGGGGSGGGWLSSFFGGGPNLPATLRATGRAATGTQNNFSALGREMHYVGNHADRLVAALTSTHAIMIAMGTVSFRQFGALDDQLTRVEAHMIKRQDWEGADARAGVRQKVLDLSGTSRTSAVDLAKGLDILTSSGMSAGMAIEALSTAENFALASGMSMEQATKRLADVQRSLGMNSTTVGDHFKNMTKLSDSFVAIAPKVGSSVDELSGAFQSRFVGAMDAANMSVEEGIALIGALSTLGERYRGRTGGEYAARLLGVTSVLNMNNMMQWKALLGRDIYDEGGKMLPMADISDLLTEKLGSLGNKKRVAQIVGAGFKSENVNLLNAMIGIGPQIRALQADLQNVGGVSAKAAEMMRRTFMGQMTTMYNLSMNVATVIGERLAPILFVFTDALASAFRWFTKLNPAFQNLIVLAGLAAVAIYPMYLGLSYIAGLALAPFFAIGSAFMMIGRMAVTASAAVIRFGLGIASFAVGSIMSVISGSIWAFNKLIEANQAIYDAFMSVVGVVTAVGKAVWNAFVIVGYHGAILLYDAVTFLTGSFRAMMNMTKDMIWSMTKLLGTVLYHGLAAIGSLLLGILPLILTIVSTLLLLPTIMFMAAFAAAGLAAVIVTVGIGLAQLGALIGAGIVAVWVGLKAAVASMFAWVMDRMENMRQAAVGVWASFKNNAVKALAVVGDALHKLAGFFWNFRENIGKIGVWWSANWEAAIRDIGRIFVAVVESMADNAMKILSAIGSMIGVLFMPIGKFIMNSFGTVMHWFATNWKYILIDAGNIFKTFIINLGQNLLTLLPIFDAIGEYIINRLAGDVLSGSTAEKDLNKIKFQLARVMGDEEGVKKFRPEGTLLETDDAGKLVLPKLRGPLEGLPKMQTGLSSLGNAMSSQFSAMWERFGMAGGKVSGIFGSLMENLTPLLGKEGVKTEAPWADLFKSLNLSMPADAMGELMKAFFGPTKQVQDASGAGEMLGKGGPGWTFRQTSMERMMVGGDDAINIEHQQLTVMQAIQRDTAVIAAANKKQDIPVLKMPRPVREGGG